jgi:hypothetical protein
LLAACDEKQQRGSASASGSAPAPAVVDKSPYCGKQPCPCEQGKLETYFGYEQCDLKAPHVVQGVPCDKGHIEFYAAGKLRQCEQTNTPYAIDGVTCGGNWHISFHKSGKLARCGSITPVTIGKYSVSGPNLALFSDGVLANGELSEDAVVDGIPCTGAVKFYPGGKLQSCWLGGPSTKAGVELRRLDSITLRPDGKVKSIMFGRKDGTIAGKPIAASISTCFDEAEKPLDKAPQDCNNIVGEMDDDNR